MTALESRLKKLEGKLATQSQEIINWNEPIPTTPEEFYMDFGYLAHPKTREPVTKLADYQIKTWQALLDHKRVLEVKSNKVGESTKWLVVDFQLAVLPTSHPLSCRGYDQLVIAQNKDHAKEHLRTLRKLIIDSPKYSKYLINKPTEIQENASRDIRSILKDEQSKTSVIYIHNPENPAKPSRIMALGIENDGAILSWKNVHNIHMSDVTAAEGDITPGINAAMTRLANTDGSMVIETVPGDPVGAIYDMWQKYRAKQWKDGDFKVIEVTAEQGVQAGIMTREFIEAEKERLGARFPRYYMAQFLGGSGNVYSTESIEKAIQLGKELTAKYGLLPRGNCEKSQGQDEGFGSSKFGEVVVQLIDGKLQVILADETDHPDIEAKAFDTAQRIQSWGIQTTQCDGSAPAYIRLLKRRIGEDPHYDEIDRERHRWMKVKPIPFSTTHKDMLVNSVLLMDKGWVAIDPKFEKLITAIRTAVAEDYSLDKDKTAHNDVLDAFRLALKPYSVGQK